MAGSPEPQATESPFNDVSSADWFYKPALWAYENGIATGTAFNPGNPCTNAEALTFLWRAEGKPAASVYNSAVALTASSQYYARPAAWAETNGLFAGADFDPVAPCSRADLMTYLYWANEQWMLSEEDKAVQAEYEQIIKDLPPYEVYDSGLFYADYIDVEGNGTVELLTVGIDWETNTATATVYANKNGCAEKLCEQAVGLAGTFDYLGLYQADGQLHFGISMAHRYVGEEHIFFKVENGAFVCSDHVRDEYDMDKDTTRYIGIHEQEISEDEYRTTYQKYTKQKKLLDVGPSWYEFGARGILPTPGIEVNGAVAELSTTPYQSMRYGFMVPLRDTLEAMGVAVYANSDASVILASTKKDTLVIAKGGALWEQGFEGINSPYYGGSKTYQYSMNGGEFQNIDIEFTDGKAYAPFETIVSLFGAKSEWNGKAGAMQIAFDLPDSNRMSRDELNRMANFDMNQARKVATNSGYEGTRFSHYDGSVYGLTFKNGKAIWTGYTYVSTIYEKDEYGNIIGGTDEYYQIEVASDGTVTANPNDKVQFTNPQI